jgi:probable phosphoglycerate mutase
VLIDARRPDAYDPDAPPLVAIAKALGRRTNNVAEYAGLIMALRSALRIGAVAIDLRLDSRLIVEQLNGRWRVRDPKIARLHAEARRLLSGFGSWRATHEPRVRNRAADHLANLALDDPREAARYVEAVARASGHPEVAEALAASVTRLIDEAEGAPSGAGGQGG